MEHQQEKHPAMSTQMTKRRIGIVLAGLGDANVDALKFLVLQMNRLQGTFEFEFLPICKDAFLDTLQGYDSSAPLKPLDRKAVKADALSFAQRYLNFLTSENTLYTLAESPPDYFIVISLARFTDEYYSARQGPVSILALGDWESHMAPPSILEFILTLIIREALASVSQRLRGSQHLGTKGCVCDFTPNLDEVRIKVLSAFLCEHCSSALVSDGYPHLSAEVRRVLRKRWLGKIDEPSSPAAIAAKLGYNLFLTKGLKATPLERAITTLQEEGVKEFVKLVAAVILAALLLWLGIKRAT
jgi:hypothetical protein